MLCFLGEEFQVGLFGSKILQEIAIKIYKTLSFQTLSTNTETVIHFQPHKRRQEFAQLLAALVEKHPTETIFVAWDNANTHEDEEVDTVVKAATGRLVLLYLPTYSPWLNPIEMHLPAFSPRSHPLRALRDHASLARSGSRVFRSVQSVARENLVRDWLSCRETCVIVLSFNTGKGR